MSHGGARKGSGRKKTFATQLKERALEEADGEARKSLDFVIRLRDNQEAELGLRHAAAIEVMDRVWGKSKTRNELTGAGGGPIQTTNTALDAVLAKMTPDQVARIALAHVERAA